MEVVDLHQLLRKLDTSGGVTNVVQVGRPGGEASHSRHHSDHHTTYSRLGRQPNLDEKMFFWWGRSNDIKVFFFFLWKTFLYFSGSQIIKVLNLWYLESKLSTVVVHATAVHETEDVLDRGVAEHSVSSDGADASISETGSHDRHALTGHLQ